MGFRLTFIADPIIFKDGKTKRRLDRTPEPTSDSFLAGGAEGAESFGPLSSSNTQSEA